MHPQAAKWYNNEMTLRDAGFLCALLCGTTHLQAATPSVGSFEISGQVSTATAGIPQLLNIVSGTNAWSVWNPPDSGATCRSGDFVRIAATRDGEARSQVKDIATRLQVVGHAGLPRTRTVSASEFTRLSRNGIHPCRLRGVVISVVRDDVDMKWNWIVLESEDGRVHAATPENEHAYLALRQLVDAEVELDGLAVSAPRWRSFMGPYLELYGDREITVVRPPPGDAFSVREISGSPCLHRQRAEGVVVGSGARTLFLDTERHGLLPIHMSPDTEPPACGTHATVAGFAAYGFNGLQLNESLIRIRPRPAAPLPTPKSIEINDLFADPSGTEISNSEFFGKTVRLRGTVRNVITDRAGCTLLRLERNGAAVLVDPTAFGPDADVRADFTIGVTGICYAEFDNSPIHPFPRFSGFIIYPRTPADLTVIDRPSWWTPARLLTVIVVLVIALVAFIIWNRSLRTLSERRGRELFRARFAHARSDLKVEERTRLAVELHDALSQTLTGVAMQIETVGSLSDALPDPVKRILGTAAQMLASCRGELQACIWDLRSRTFDEKDMTEAVTRTVDTHIGSARLAVRFNVPRSLLSETTTHAILRIVRELAVNAVRHGKATDIRIAGNLEDDVIRFSVTDNGRGFSPDAAPGPRDGHFGLQGIRERLNGFAGSLEIESQPGKGTRVKVTMKPNEEK